MKLKILFLFILCNVIASTQCFGDDSKKANEPVTIILRTNSNLPTRSLNPHIEACYHINEERIEIYGENIEEARVYILDNNGEFLSEDSFDSNFGTTLMIDVPLTSGTYWLIVQSVEFYAEGTFHIN